MRFPSKRSFVDLILGIINFFASLWLIILGRVVYCIIKIIFPSWKLSHFRQNDPPVINTNLSRRQILNQLKKEKIRLDTFQDWDDYLQDPRILAKAGFFYFNRFDQVQCAFCLGIIGGWNECHEPFIEHRKLYPNCPFVLGYSVGNQRIVPPIQVKFQSIVSLFKIWVFQCVKFLDFEIRFQIWLRKITCRRIVRLTKKFFKSRVENVIQSLYSRN